MLLIHQGNGIRGLFDLYLKEFMNALFTRGRLLGSIPGDQHLLSFSLRQERELREPLIRVGNKSTQPNLKMSNQALHGLFHKQIRRILQHTPKMSSSIPEHKG